MKTRIISGVIAAVLLIGALALSVRYPFVLNIVMALIAALAAYEICGAAHVRKHVLILGASIVMAAFLPFVPMLPTLEFPIVQTVLYGYLLLLFVHQLGHHRDVPVPDVVTAAVVSIFSSAALTAVVRVRDIGGARHGLFLLIVSLLAAWSSDSGAYFVGVLCGKHKLCPQISPKKTVEGFVGGIVSCIVILEAAALVYSRWIAPGTKINWILLAVLAGCCSVISVVGDLTFSLIKRHYGIKDYGNIMPGHGGALDRFDSVIFVAPFFALVIQYLPIIHA